MNARFWVHCDCNQTVYASHHDSPLSDTEVFTFSASNIILDLRYSCSSTDSGKKIQWSIILFMRHHHSPGWQTPTHWYAKWKEVTFSHYKESNREQCKCQQFLKVSRSAVGDEGSTFSAVGLDLLLQLLWVGFILFCFILYEVHSVVIQQYIFYWFYL